MGLLDDISRVRAGWRGQRSWPVGQGVVEPWDVAHGHHDPYAPSEYGDYIATSNDVYACAMLRARLLSSLPLRLYRGRGTDKVLIEDGQVADLLRRVNPHWTWPRLARMDELSMCLWGKTFWALEPGRDGRPAEIWWLKPDRVRPVPHESGYLSGYLYEPVRGGASIAFAADEVVWFRYPNPLDEFSGLSPLVAARLAADTASAATKANRNLFVNGMMGGGLITPTTDKVSFTDEQARDLERQFAARLKGVDKAHRWAVLRYEAKVQALNVTPRDAEFLGGLQLSLRQVANAYGLPSALLNDLEHVSLATVDGLVKSMWTNTLVPDTNLKGAEITEQLLPRFSADLSAPDHAEHDYTQVAALQESASESWAREAQALDRGALTINEWRTQKGLPPVPWGDVWWAPVNKSAVTDASSAPQGDTTATTLPDDETNPATTPEPRSADLEAVRDLLTTLRTPINGWRH